MTLAGDVSAPGALIDIDLTGAGALAVSATAFISAAGGANTGSVDLQNANGSISLSSGSQITSGSAGNLVVRAIGTGATITHGGTLTSGTGATGLALRADDGVVFSVPISLPGRLLIDANANNNAVGSLTLNNPVNAAQGVELRAHGIIGNAGATVTSTNSPILIQSSAALDIIDVIQSGGGTITLSAGGTLDVGAGMINSGGGNIVVSSTNAMTLFGPITSSGGNVTLSTAGSGGLSIQNDITTSGGNISITAANGLLQNTAGSQLDASGGAGTGQVFLESANGTQSLILAASVSAGSGGITLRAGENVSINAAVIASGNITVAADTNNGGAVGSIAISAPLSATGSGAISMTGITLSQSGTGTITSAGGAISGIFANAFAISRAVTSTASSVLMRSINSTLTVDAGVSGAQGVELRGIGITGNAGGTITATNSPILVQSSGALDYIAAIQSGGSTITLSAGSTLDAGTGLISSGGGNIALTSVNTLTLFGPINSGGGNVTASTTGTGALSIQNDITTSGGNIAINAFNGLISTSAGSDLNATGGAGTGRVALESLNASQGLTLAGSVSAGSGGVGLRAGGNIAINASISAPGNITIAANTDNGVLGGIAISAPVSATATGTILMSGVVLSQSGTGTISTSGGTISANFTAGSTVSRAVTSLGGNVVLQSLGGLTVSATVSSASAQPANGTLRWYGNVTATILPTVGSGDVTLDGGGNDLVLSAPINVTSHTEFGANRDVIVNAAMVTPSTKNLYITAGRSGASADGGVVISSTGSLNSGGNLVVQGRRAVDLSAASNAIYSAASSSTITAAGNVRIAGASNSPVSAGVRLGGSVFANAGSLHVSTPRTLTLANGADLTATNGTALLSVGEQLVQTAGSVIEVVGGSNLLVSVGGIATLESLKNSSPAGAIAVNATGNIVPRASGVLHLAGAQLALSTSGAIASSALRLRVDGLSLAARSTSGTAIETLVAPRAFVVASSTPVSAQEVSLATGNVGPNFTLPAIAASNVTGTGDFLVTYPTTAPLRIDHPVNVSNGAFVSSSGAVSVNAPITASTVTMSGTGFDQASGGSITAIDGALDAQFSGSAIISQPLSSNGNLIRFFANGGLTVNAAISSAPPVGGNGVLLVNGGVVLNTQPVLGDGDILLRGSACASNYSTSTSCDLDVDGDAQLTTRDALLAIRHMLGMRDAGLRAGLAFDSCNTRYSSSALATFLAARSQFDSSINGRAYDFDGDGDIRATTDGVLFARAAAGLPATTLISGGVVQPGAPRSNATSLRTYLNTTCGLSIAP
jgi:Dockerin type I domain